MKLDELNVHGHYKEKNPKRDLTSVKDKAIMLLEGRDSPHIIIIIT